jgi:hypothetical protein
MKWKNDPQNNYTSEFMMCVVRDPRLPKLKVPLREPKEVEYGATTQLTANPQRPARRRITYHNPATQ